MDKIRIVGGKSLNGTVVIGGAKNAALPLMTAALLTEEPLTLDNIPSLGDVHTMSMLLRQHGVSVTLDPAQKRLVLQGKTIENILAPYDIVRKMRASILVLGPLLARTGQARVSLPGGCAIGARPVDLHLKGLEALGARISLKEGYIEATVPHRLKGTSYTFPVVSVTGTANLMMAAALAEGTTTLIQVAKEPEIINLADCLNRMGACIEGAGTDTLTIQGVSRLSQATCAIIPDRIEIGTYALAAAITGGTLFLKNADASLLPVPVFEEAGISVQQHPDGLHVTAPQSLQSLEVTTAPFPGFATDLQAQLMALLTLTPGQSRITENIYENRFIHVPELARMGAQVTIQGACARITGVPKLTGAPVMATDLRASFCLVLAGLAAKGETLIHRVYHLDRGYERVEEKLSSCGATIERI